MYSDDELEGNYNLIEVNYNLVIIINECRNEKVDIIKPYFFMIIELK